MHDWEIIEPGGNIGFGSGHNLAIFNFQSDYHLVLNPDVLVAEDALRHALLFMEDNQDIGMLTPDIRGLNGIKQNLCKYYPSVTHLFIRGFLSNSLRSWVERYLQPYEVHLRDQVTVLSNSMMASGCFMFIRHSLIDTIRGFSPDFFIYFEDFDLSRRINKVSHIAYVPQVRIVHRGGYASRKGVGHVLMFARSASMFFNKYGWRWF